MIDAHEGVLQARERYLAASGFTTESYTAPHLVVKVGFVTLRFRNPGLLPLHDLHHVATGYEATLLGGAEISVFELCAGPGTLLIAFLCCGSILVGLFLSPMRMWNAWKSAREARSLYTIGMPSETLLSMNVGELRKLMGLEG